MAEVLLTVEAEPQHPAVLCVNLPARLDECFANAVQNLAQVNSACGFEVAIAELARQHYSLVIVNSLSDTGHEVAKVAQQKEIPCIVLSHTKNQQPLHDEMRLCYYDDLIHEMHSILVGVLPPHPNT